MDDHVNKRLSLGAGAKQIEGINQSGILWNIFVPFIPGCNCEDIIYGAVT